MFFYRLIYYPTFDRHLHSSLQTKQKKRKYKLLSYKMKKKETISFTVYNGMRACISSRYVLLILPICICEQNSMKRKMRTKLLTNIEHICVCVCGSIDYSALPVFCMLQFTDLCNLFQYDLLRHLDVYKVITIKYCPLSVNLNICELCFKMILYQKLHHIKGVEELGFLGIRKQIDS